MFNFNAHMQNTLRQAQQIVYQQARQQQANEAAAKAAELSRQADLLAQEAKKKENEANLAIQVAENSRLELIETLRVNALLQRATQEVNGTLASTNNIKAIFEEKPDVVARFIATNPLEGAIISNSLDAIKLLVENGQRYDSWADIVDEDTPLYKFLAERFIALNSKPNLMI